MQFCVVQTSSRSQTWQRVPMFETLCCNFVLSGQRLWEPIDRLLICCCTIPSFYLQLIWSLSKWTAIDREQVATLCRDGIGPSRRELATDNSLQHSLPLLPSTQTKSVNLRKVWLKPKRLWVKCTWWGRSLKRAYCCARCPSDCRCRAAPSATPANKSMIQWWKSTSYSYLIRIGPKHRSEYYLKYFNKN